MKIDANINIDVSKILRSRGLGDSKEAQRFIAEDVERLCRPYVPMSAGSGVHMVNQAEVTDDSITYPGPYAHYQYVGEVMGPNYTDGNGNFWSGDAPKHYTGRELTYHGGPMRGKEWEKRALADSGKELERDLEDYFKEKSK